MNSNSFSSLQYKPFRNYLIQRFTILLAIAMQSLVIGWEIYRITNDPLSLGLIGLAEIVPAIGLALFAGHFVDKQDKRKVLLWCAVAFVLSNLLFLIATLPSIQILLDSRMILFMIYTTAFTGGVIRAFSVPASFTTFGKVVPKEAYANAATWSSAAWQLGAVLGPGMGGFIYNYLGLSVALGFVTLFFIIGLIAITSLEPMPAKEIENKAESIWTGLGEGLKFVFKTKEVLGALSLDMFAVLFGGAVALLPVFAKDILMVGPKGLGILRAAPGVGALITFFIVANVPLEKNAGKKLLACVFSFGVTMIVFAISSSFVVSMAALFLSGVFDGVSVVIRQTILQLRTPENMKGRVSAVNSIFVGSSNEIGAFESGLAARLMGTVPSVLFGGCVTLLVVGITYFISPSMRNLKLK
jgi:MFS family permease